MIVIISNNDIFTYIQIQQRLVALSSECGMPLSLTPMYPGKEYYIVMYVESTPELETLEKSLTPESKSKVYNYIEVKPDMIKAFLLLFTIDDGYEIYNVCTGIQDRRRGYMSMILNNLSTIDNIWLCIDFDNPNFDTVIKFYVKHGFNNPYRTNKSAAYADMGREVLGLVKSTKITPLPDQDAINVGTNIKNNYYIELVESNKFMYIPPNVIDPLFDLLSRDIEVAGGLKVDQYVTNPYNPSDKATYAQLGIDQSQIYYGSGKNVACPDSTITFHTHPTLLYASEPIFLAFPTTTDLKAVLTHIDCKKYPSPLHYVITAEGVYTMVPSTVLEMAYLTWTDDCKEFIFNSIPEYTMSFLEYQDFSFMSIEDRLSMFVKGNIKEVVNKSVLKYLNLVNQFTFKMAIEVLKNSDDLSELAKMISCVESIKKLPGLDNINVMNTPLFYINLYTWESIKQSGGLFHIVTNYVPRSQTRIP
jgi:hypothetical protein